MSVLSDKEILERMANMDIVIYPYSSEQLNSGSYNIKLGGYHYMALRDAHVPGLPKNHTFDIPPGQDFMSTISGWKLGNVSKWTEKPIDIFPNKYGDKPTVEPLWSRCRTGDIVLRPGDVALCHSEEYIGSLKGSITELRARSTLMRNCLALAPSAGWGDVNFVNRWGFTIHNYGHRTIRLHPGDEVGQIVFHSIGDVLNPYSGTYAQKESTEKEYNEYCRNLLLNWDPIHLLSSVQREAQKKLTPPSRNEEQSSVDTSDTVVKDKDKEEDKDDTSKGKLRQEVTADAEKLSLIDIENDKILKIVQSKIFLSINPEGTDCTDKVKAVRVHTAICLNLFDVIAQTYTNIEPINNSWKQVLFQKIHNLVSTWTVSKYEINDTELDKLSDKYWGDTDEYEYEPIESILMSQIFQLATDLKMLIQN